LADIEFENAPLHIRDELQLKRGYTVMIIGAILIVAGFIIVIPSIMTIFSAVKSVSADDIVRIIANTILGWFGISPDSTSPPSRVPIALSVAGIVVAPILLVDGALALIGGSILSVMDMRKERKAPAIHRTDADAA
jgi:hypothetical protein